MKKLEMQKTDEVTDKAERLRVQEYNWTDKETPLSKKYEREVRIDM